jgi:hypothetical protein
MFSNGGFSVAAVAPVPKCSESLFSIAPDIENRRDLFKKPSHIG